MCVFVCGNSSLYLVKNFSLISSGNGSGEDLSFDILKKVIYQMMSERVYVYLKKRTYRSNASNNITVSTYFINLILFLFFFFNYLFIFFKSFIIYKKITFFVTRKLYVITGFNNLFYV